MKVSAGSSKVSKKASLSKILDEFDKEGYYTLKRVLVVKKLEPTD